MIKIQNSLLRLLMCLVVSLVVASADLADDTISEEYGTILEGYAST
jgi:hypothetical protein